MDPNCASQTDAYNNLNFYTDSKYNNVDKDWIDVKSNNYFSNEEFKDSGPPKVDPVWLLLIKQESNDIKKIFRIPIIRYDSYHSSDKESQVANETLEWVLRLN